MPGAGKTVQSQLLQEKLGYHWLSTGQMLRETEDTEVLEVVASGALVNDEMVIRIVEQRLKKEGHDNTFLLDGFPRNTDQAQWLIEHGEKIGKHIQAILFLDVSLETSQERLGGRGRADDTDDALAKRREEQKKLEPMVDYMKSQGIAVEVIDANRSVEEVFASIQAALGRHIEK